jgi:hypothetical protein
MDKRIFLRKKSSIIRSNEESDMASWLRSYLSPSNQVD